MIVTKQELIHRRYPDFQWDYKGVSTYVKDNGIIKNIIYYTLVDKGAEKEGIEIYQGKNYIVGSKDSSYSRVFTMNNYPKKYKDIVESAKKIHKEAVWSSAEYVNMN